MKGLSSERVAEQTQKWGYNELPSSREKGLLRIAIEVIREPMFLLLIGCGTLYMVLGEFRGGFVLSLAVILIILITFFQYRKTTRALEALKRLASPRALVIREGKECRIPGREVVPEDLLLLHEGDRIPADAILVESLGLVVDESMLTGESAAVRKEAGKNEKVFGGTLVVSGNGKAIVTETGSLTEFGLIGTSLSVIEPGETGLQKEMRAVIRMLLWVGLFTSAFVVVAFYWSRGNFLRALLNGLASSMAILPEEFPVVLTVFMAIGAWRLSKKNVLTRSSASIETLGAATVLCADKTGTITQNKMQVAALYNGTTLLLRDTFDQRPEGFKELVHAARSASGKTTIDPMELAIGNMHEEWIENAAFDWEVVKEYPLTDELLAMTQVIGLPDKEEFPVAAKGVPEAIFQLCKLDQKETEKYLVIVQQLAYRGYRILGVASATVNATRIPEEQKDFAFQMVGLIAFEDPIRPELPQAISECHHAGIKVIMITGDYPDTAKHIASQIGLPQASSVISGAELDNMSDDSL